MATMEFCYCDRHLLFSKRIEATTTGTTVEIDGIKLTLDLCKTCHDAITGWQDLAQQAAANGGIQEPPYNGMAVDLPKHLHSHTSA